MFGVGGFKVWECCVDLIKFLAEQKLTFLDKLVLEVIYYHVVLEQ